MISSPVRSLKSVAHDEPIVMRFSLEQEISKDELTEANLKRKTL
jgi:hypothetical protein